MESNRRYEENPEIVSKSEKFGFSANFAPKHSFLPKSRQSWLDTVLLSCDKIHKGYKILEIFLETLTIH